MISRALPPPRRWLVYASAGWLVAAAGLSRLYLGVHWFSDVLAGIGLGLVWVSALGLAYTTREEQPLGALGLSLTAVAAMVAAAAMYIPSSHETERARHTPPSQTLAVAETAWWKGDWQTLPRRRNDVPAHPDHPLNLQWAGTAVAVTDLLQRMGWREPPALTLSSSLQSLNPAPAIENLPVLPHVHAGNHEDLMRVRHHVESHRRLVIRLWDSGVRLQPRHVPLWIGNISFQDLRERGGLFVYAHTAGDFETPLEVLARELAAMPLLRAQHVSADHVGSGGSLLLVGTARASTSAP